MDRREFLRLGGAAILGAAAGDPRILGGEPAGGLEIAWSRREGSRLFDGVAAGGRPLVAAGAPALLAGTCRPIGEGAGGPEVLVGPDGPDASAGPVRLALSHRLHASQGGSREDLLEAVLELENGSDRPRTVVAGFLSAASPCGKFADGTAYLPLSAAGLNDKPDDPRRRLKDCRQPVGAEGILAHYLEPAASDPRGGTARAALLAPVVDISAEGGPCRVALFGVSDAPAFFEAGERGWRMGRKLLLGPGQKAAVRAFLLIHAGDAAEAWSAFHRFGHGEDFPPVGWTREVRVHYFDFISPAVPDGVRGGGYERDLPLFPAFRVGMATQHGYYRALGDYLHPDRKEWMVAPTDPKGPAPMSLEKMRARIAATRKAGAHPMIYLHFSLFDESTPYWEKLQDSIQVSAEGKRMPFGWEGPDVVKFAWKMSAASPAWRDHLVGQARWVMELLDPDGIVLDETFTAWGIDHHREHGGPLSPGGIDLMRRLRATVRSFGPDKALFASDCSMANFSLWADGEAGDHAYDRLLGHPLYREPPVRYLAALGSKAWLPCAWLFRTLWDAQMDLARKVGAGVGMSSGWNENTGLAFLPPDVKERMVRDIATLFPGSR